MSFSLKPRLTDYKLPKGDKGDLNTWIHVVEHDEVDGCLYGKLDKHFEAVQKYDRETKRYVMAKYNGWVKLQRRLGEKMVRGKYAEPSTSLVQASDFTTVAPGYSEEESYEDNEDVEAQQSFAQVPIDDMLKPSDSILSSVTKGLETDWKDSAKENKL